jgi:hypothetical protein
MNELVCCICLDDIISNKNITTTECGHTFHCRCLMQNTAHNGYDCPYCRTVMAEIPNADDETDYDDESIYDSDDDEGGIDDNILTSFRMFHQRTSGDYIEDEIETETETEQLETEPIIPSPEYIAQIFTRQGVTLEDMVKALLVDHDEYDSYIIEKKSDELFGRMRIIISNYVSEHTQ